MSETRRRPQTLEADRPGITPLIDIAFLVLIFFMALPYKTLDRKLEAHLPTERGIGVPRAAEPPPRVVVRVHRTADGHRFRVGTNVADHAAGLAGVLRALGDGYRYEIHADGHAAWRGVVEAVDTLKALGYTRIDFRGCKLPGNAIRRAPRLPLPDGQ